MAFPKYYNFDYYRGDTFEIDIELKDQNGVSDFNIGLYENVNFTIANQRGSSGTKTVASAEKIDPNIVRCRIVPSVGRTLAAGTYFYDVQITDTTPDPDIIYTILTGTMTVTDDVTGS